MLHFEGHQHSSTDQTKWSFPHSTSAAVQQQATRIHFVATLLSLLVSFERMRALDPSEDVEAEEPARNVPTGSEATALRSKAAMAASSAQVTAHPPIRVADITANMAAAPSFCISRPPKMPPRPEPTPP